MWRRLQTIGLTRVFGRGPAGLVAAGAIGWLTDQIKKSKEPERLDTARLVPGETYLVTTRPGMNRAERRDAKRLRGARGKLTKATRPTRKVRRTAAKASAAQRKAGKAKPGTKRRVRNERKAEVLLTRYERLTTPTPQQLKLERRVAELSARMDAHRAHALATARRGKRRAPRTRTFT